MLRHWSSYWSIHDILPTAGAAARPPCLLAVPSAIRKRWGDSAGRTHNTGCSALFQHAPGISTRVDSHGKTGCCGTNLGRLYWLLVLMMMWTVWLTHGDGDGVRLISNEVETLADGGGRLGCLLVEFELAFCPPFPRFFFSSVIPNDASSHNS